MVTDQLWGGILDSLSLDVVTQTLGLSVSVTHGDRSCRHEIRLKDVYEFRFVNAIPGPWDYAEVTELHFARDLSSDLWRFDIMLWSEDASITGRCGSVTVDGLDL
jgi:hypothetical protein